MSTHLNTYHFSVCGFRYEDFFGGKKTDKNKKSKKAGRSDDMDTDDEPSGHDNNQVTYAFSISGLSLLCLGCSHEMNSS